MKQAMQPLLLGPHLGFILRPTFEAMEATNQEANSDGSANRYLKRKTVRRHRISAFFYISNLIIDA